MNLTQFTLDYVGDVSVVYLPMTERAPATVLEDVTGNGRDGTPNGIELEAPSLVASDEHAIDLNGGSVEATFNIQQPDGRMTVAWWMGDGQTEMALSTDMGDGTVLAAVQPDGSLELQISYLSNYTATVDDPGSAPYHVAAVMDPIAEEARIYLDGMFVSYISGVSLGQVTGQSVTLSGDTRAQHLLVCDECLPEHHLQTLVDAGRREHDIAPRHYEIPADVQDKIDAVGAEQSFWWSRAMAYSRPQIGDRVFDLPNVVVGSDIRLGEREYGSMPEQGRRDNLRVEGAQCYRQFRPDNATSIHRITFALAAHPDYWRMRSILGVGYESVGQFIALKVKREVRSSDTARIELLAGDRHNSDSPSSMIARATPETLDEMTVLLGSVDMENRFVHLAWVNSAGQGTTTATDSNDHILLAYDDLFLYRTGDSRQGQVGDFGEVFFGRRYAIDDPDALLAWGRKIHGRNR